MLPNTRKHTLSNKYYLQNQSNRCPFDFFKRADEMSLKNLKSQYADVCDYATNPNLNSCKRVIDIQEFNV
jgi:hypothetical protein